MIQFDQYLSNGLKPPTKSPISFRCREFIAICPTLNPGGYQLGLEAGGTIPPLPTLGIFVGFEISPTKWIRGRHFVSRYKGYECRVFILIRFTKRFFERLFATNWLIHFDGKAYDVMSFSNVFHSCA